MRININESGISFNRDSGGSAVLDESILKEIEERLKNINDKVEYSDKIPTDEDIVIWINPEEDLSEDYLIRINDETIASNTVWSSEKVNNVINEIFIQADSHIHLNKDVLDKITASDIDKWNNKSDFNGSYRSLTDKPYIPSIEGLASEEYVDSAIENIPKIDLSEYATKEELHEHENENILDSITEEKINSWNNKSNFDGDYNNLTNKPNIPTHTSELENDSNFISEIPSEYITETELENTINNIEKTVSSNMQPTDDNVTLWVNTSEDETTAVTRINDETVASNTTWSSEKVNTLISSLKLIKEGNVVKLMLGDIELSNINI